MKPRGSSCQNPVVFLLLVWTKKLSLTNMALLNVANLRTTKSAEKKQGWQMAKDEEKF